MNHPTVQRACRLAAVTAALGLVVTACSDDGTSRAGSATTVAPTASTVSALADPVIDPGDGGDYTPSWTRPTSSPSSTTPTCPSWRAAAGPTRKSTAKARPSDIEVVVLDQTREIAGITATVVRDTRQHRRGAGRGHPRLLRPGRRRQRLVPRRRGGQLRRERRAWSTTDGSFEVGVDGAYAGIVMEADPRGREMPTARSTTRARPRTWVRCCARARRRSVPRRRLHRRRSSTRDWNPLEPDIIEEKYFAPGVGQVREATGRGRNRRRRVGRHGVGTGALIGRDSPVRVRTGGNTPWCGRR